MPPGTAVAVAGQQLPGGMLYVGTRLSAAAGGVDPALINPRLSVDHRRPDWKGESMGYWPSYSTITPQARAAYLAWLAGGRRAPLACIGYVFLFFYGLERRLLVEGDQCGPGERETLLAEVRRLLALYGGSYSFNSYATGLLAAATDPTATDWTRRQPPEPTRHRDLELPIDLRVGLAQHIDQEKPIPATWAVAWHRDHPDTYLRTPATRCPDEFAALLARLYRREFGDGMRLKRNRKPLSLEYRAASSGIGETKVTHAHLPDVNGLKAPVAKLQDLVNETTDALDAYSRYLGRNPDKHGSPAALALLPDGLTPPANPAADALWGWADTGLGREVTALVPTVELIAHWPDANGKLSKNDAVLIARLLEKRGLGIEPDVRFGGSTPSASGSVVLFRRMPDQNATPSPDYPMALAMVNLGTAVAIADGSVTEPERRAIEEYATTNLDLSADELRRLDAHAALVMAAPPTPAALKRRLTAVPQQARASIADLLTDIAAADGDVGVHEVRALERLYSVLGLDPAQVYGHLHGKAATSDEPVPLREAGSPSRRVPIPPKGAAVTPTPTATGGVALDAAVLARKRAESERVALQLAEIFADEEAAPVQAPPPAVVGVAGLDGEHTAFFGRLVVGAEWTRAEVEDLATGLGMLVDGALDTLNEAAFDAVGAPLWEGADPILINDDVAEEMRS